MMIVALNRCSMSPGSSVRTAFVECLKGLAVDVRVKHVEGTRWLHVGHHVASVANGAKREAIVARDEASSLCMHHQKVSWLVGWFPMYTWRWFTWLLTNHGRHGSLTFRLSSRIQERVPGVGTMPSTSPEYTRMSTPACKHNSHAG